MTAVDSGSKALELLGLNGEQEVEGGGEISVVEAEETPSVSSNCQEMEVNLIITDYFMPGMTGYDLLRKIKVYIYIYNQHELSLVRIIYFFWFSQNRVFIPFFPSCHMQESKSYKDVPVVIMSSENVPSRISR